MFIKLNIFISAIILSLFLIVACTKRIETIEVPIERVSLDLGHPDPLHLENMTWYIVEHDGKIYFSIMSSDYKRLAINMEKIQSFILKQKDIIEAQKNYYESGSDGH